MKIFSTAFLNALTAIDTALLDFVSAIHRSYATANVNEQRRIIQQQRGFLVNNPKDFPHYPQRCTTSCRHAYNKTAHCIWCGSLWPCDFLMGRLVKNYFAQQDKQS